MSDDGSRALAATIIFTAVQDWRLLKRKELENYKIRRSQCRIGTQELKDFFNSTWFDNLCEMVGMDAVKILAQL